MARKMKRLSLAKKRAVIRKLSRPGSVVRELTDWHRRDGTGPIPKAVKRALKRYRTISLAIRAEHRLIISKQTD